MGKSNRLKFLAGLDRKPEWTGAGLRRFYCTRLILLHCLFSRYQALYARKATKVSEPGSKIADEIEENQSALIQQTTSQLNTSTNVSRRISESRDLPKWMMQRDKSDTSVRSSLDMSRSDSTSSTDGKIK